MLNMLLVGRFMDLREITCISDIRVINSRFHLFRSSRFFLLQPISSSVSQNIKELRYFSSYSSYFRHCPSMPSWRWQFLLGICPISWLFYARYCLEAFSSRLQELTFSDQHSISKLSKFFRSNFLSVQVSE